MISWQKKKTNGEWEWWNDSNPVTEGTYRLAVQVRIDQVTGCGETHVLADPCSVTINGVSWGSMTNPSVDTTYCYNWIDSPEITIEKTAIPLNFTTYNDSIVSYVDTDIETIDLTNKVVGGQGSYTFSKTSGPSWINVSTGGKISGAPTTIGENQDLVVRVTDEANEYKEITIAVTNTYPKQSAREQVTEIEATSNIDECLVYGEVPAYPEFTITKPANMVRFPDSMGSWWKLKDGEWVRVEYGEKVTEGTYSFNMQVRVDQDTGYGYTHMLGDPCSIKIDGVAWETMTNPAAYDGFSWNWTRSQSFTVENPYKIPVVDVNEENFPDMSFRQTVSADIDLNNDGNLSQGEINEVKELLIGDHRIGTLKGIEYFTNLEKLDCKGNGNEEQKLDSLDVSKFTKLKYLDCGDNELTKLDVTKNPKLEILYCDDNKLTALDTSKNPELKELFATQQDLMDIDISNNPKLEWLGCWIKAKTIDISHLTELTYLYCQGPNLEALDVSNNRKLETLGCVASALTSIDISNVMGGVSLSVFDNEYTIYVGKDRTFDLTKLPGNFDVNRTSEWEGGSVNGTILTIAADVDEVTYKYDCGKNESEYFTLKVQNHKVEAVDFATKSYTYDGKTKKPAVTVKDESGNVLTKDTDYTVVYKNNKYVGTATATITGIGDYEGTVTAEFTIKPVKTSIKKVYKARKAFTVKWTKKSTQVTGYRIKYSTSSKFTDSKYVTVTKYKTTSKKIKGLKAKQTYYVRVQTYKTVNGKKYYSDWSTAKSVKTK